jgi:hypothetical protein
MRSLVAAMTGALGGALLVSFASVAGAQSSPDEVRKRHIGCAAVLGVAATISADKKAQDALSGVSMLLLTWATELGSAKDKDQTTRAFAGQVTEIGRAIKVGTPTTAKDFEEKYGSTRKACEAWFLAETKKRKG